MNAEQAQDEASFIQTLLREVDRRVAALPRDTFNRSVGIDRVRKLIGEQLRELHWWKL